ncbi:hypothetical protein GJ744_006902 [Endocarpon pusillum]|uniref:Uncharacterized protein n=1 Tax=Endocarpon pusillum TaxID=364733 RepID=A0A8H7E7X8_9EURO|nr:hypothetical protein GJ744_006902 [Endocarpon pusillum]
MKLPWPVIWHLEKLLVLRLLRSPSFHRGVQGIHKTLHRLRHGPPPEELGGTRLDDPGDRGPRRFMQLFWEELKNGTQTRPNNKK